MSEVEKFIASWTPSARSTVQHWSAIGPTVTAIIRASQPGGCELASKYLRALAKHVDRRHDAGMNIGKWSELLSDSSLEATLGPDVGGTMPSTRRTELTFLRRIRERALPDEYGKAKGLTIARSEVARPYSSREVAALLAWPKSTSSQTAERVLATVVLGLSTGMDGREMPGLRGSDVQRSPWGLVVQAPGTGNKNGSRPARIVPVLAEYERELARLAIAAGNAPIVGEAMLTARSLERVASEMAKTANMPHLSGGRLRATWTRTLLARHAPYIAMRQAGVSCDPSHTLGILSTGLTMSAEQFICTLRFGTSEFDANSPSFAALTPWSGA